MNNSPDPSLINRLAALVNVLQPESRGWRMICASPQGALSAVVHMRPHLSDAQMPPGFRVEMLGAVPLSLSGHATYPNLFVCSERCDLPPEVDALAVMAEGASQPWLMLQVADGSGAIRLYEKDGTRPAFTAEPPAARLSRARILIQGREPMEVEEMFPFALGVSSSESAATFSVELQSPGLSDGVRHYVVDGVAPIGGGALEFDVRCRVGAPDELVVRASGFAAPVTVSELALPPKGPSRPSFRIDKAVCLHVLFDRTTLDPNAWPVALEATTGFSQAAPNEDDLGIYQKRERQAEEPLASKNWNRGVRAALGLALAEEIGQLHGGETYFHLWWFADTPKPGIADMKAVSALREPCGEGGVCGPGSIRQRLNEDGFGYAPGFDLFDASDEALERLALVVEESVTLSREQHAVLIVGDSPPPPSGKSDALWTRLVAGPPRTNARCSPLFAGSLRKLHDLGVPIGWLYLTLSESPTETRAIYRHSVEQYQYFISLRREISRALQLVGGEHMIVETCDGLGEMGGGLRTLFKRMSQRKPELSLLEFSGPVAGGRTVKAWT